MLVVVSYFSFTNHRQALRFPERKIPPATCLFRCSTARPRPGSISLDQFAPLIASSAPCCGRRCRLQPPDTASPACLRRGQEAQPPLLLFLELPPCRIRIGLAVPNQRVLTRLVVQHHQWRSGYRPVQRRPALASAELDVEQAACSCPICSTISSVEHTGRGSNP